MTRFAIAMIFILVLLGGSIWLQIFLSRKQNKWLGLIIPLVCFVFSIMTVLSMALFQTVHTTESLGDLSIGKVTESWQPNVIEVFASVTPVFLLFNIPTIIFLAIYFASREKIKLQEELDKMNIEDLD